MTPSERLSRIAMLPVAPVLFVQAKRLRRETVILPEATGDWHGRLPANGEGGEPLRMLVLGDSTAAGVGADTQHDALPGNLARGLVERFDRTVDWTAIGESGITSRGIVERYLGRATASEYDLVFLSIGANDALGLRSRVAFARDVRVILAALRRASPDAVLLMSSLPAFSRFELLPDPLRRHLYRHSSSLEAAAREVVEDTAGAGMSPPPPPYTAGFFATDLFHPSASGYRDWAEFALDDAASAGWLGPLAS